MRITKLGAALIAAAAFIKPGLELATAFVNKLTADIQLLNATQEKEKKEKEKKVIPPSPPPPSPTPQPAKDLAPRTDLPPLIAEVASRFDRWKWARDREARLALEESNAKLETVANECGDEMATDLVQTVKDYLAEATLD